MFKRIMSFFFGDKKPVTQVSILGSGNVQIAVPKASTTPSKNPQAVGRASRHVPKPVPISTYVPDTYNTTNAEPSKRSESPSYDYTPSYYGSSSDCSSSSSSDCGSSSCGCD